MEARVFCVTTEQRVAHRNPWLSVTLTRRGYSRGLLRKMALKAGDAAPDFSLPAVSGEREYEFRLSDYRGKQCVVVTFHPLDWTPT